VAERKPSDSSYADSLLAEFAAGNAPDVIFASTDNVDQLVNSG
jgi:maltose-binding protein MalE